MGELRWEGQKSTWLEKIIKMNSWKESSSRTFRKKVTASGISSRKSMEAGTTHRGIPAINSSLAPLSAAAGNYRRGQTDLALTQYLLGPLGVSVG